MLLVKTYVAPSKIQGQGLFAAQDIKKGTITWRFNPEIDKEYSIKEFESLSGEEKLLVKHSAVLSKISNKYILSSDNTKFTNHSSDPNLGAVIEEGQIEMVAKAKRDIKKDEELTIDYRTIDKSDETSSEEYLKQ
jgi:SET domain-containing protein